MFPSTEPKDLPNLIQFVLENVQSKLRSHHIVSSCSQDCVQFNIQKAHLAVSVLHRKIERMTRRYNRLLPLIERNNLKVPEKLKLESTVVMLKSSINKTSQKLGRASLLYRHLSSGDRKIFGNPELQKLLGQDENKKIGPSHVKLSHEEL